MYAQNLTHMSMYIHLPARVCIATHSVLTEILKESLGGNATTCVMCCVSLRKEHNRQTKHTLHFGATAQRVVNTVSVNEVHHVNTRLMVKQFHNKGKAKARIHSIFRLEG